MNYSIGLGVATMHIFYHLVFGKILAVYPEIRGWRGCTKFLGKFNDADANMKRNNFNSIGPRIISVFHGKSR